MLTTDITIEDTLSASWDKACDEMEGDFFDGSLVAAGAGIAAIQANHPYQDRTGNLSHEARVVLGEFAGEADMIFPAKNERGEGYASFVNAMNRENGHRKNYEFISRGEKACRRVLDQETQRAVVRAGRNVGVYSGGLPEVMRSANDND